MKLYYNLKCGIKKYEEENVMLYPIIIIEPFGLKIGDGDQDV